MKKLINKLLSKFSNCPVKVTLTGEGKSYYLPCGTPSFEFPAKLKDGTKCTINSTDICDYWLLVPGKSTFNVEFIITNQSIADDFIESFLVKEQEEASASEYSDAEFESELTAWLHI